MILLGSTGSIGQNALEIARRFSLPVEVLSAGRNIKKLNEQIAEFQPKIVVIADPQDQAEVSLPANTRLLFGMEGIKEALNEAKSTLVLNAIVGFIGLHPTLEALRLKKTVALANKESLVTAGKFLETSRIVPIDSEHFSLWFLHAQRPIERLFITASGGAFRDTPLKSIPSQSVTAALKHPNWSMGKKITIDSATMANKLLELLEARWLFKTSKIDALIERNSLVHALIGHKDGSYTAHIAPSDMKLPLAYAMLGEVTQNILPPLDLMELPSIHFKKIDPARYPLWNLKEELIAKPWLGTAFNAANEVAVEKFLTGKTDFGTIARIVEKTVGRFDQEPESLETLFALDAEVRRFADKL